MVMHMTTHDFETVRSQFQSCSFLLEKVLIIIILLTLKCSVEELKDLFSDGDDLI